MHQKNVCYPYDGWLYLFDNRNKWFALTDCSSGIFYKSECYVLCEFRAEEDSAGEDAQ